MNALNSFKGFAETWERINKYLKFRDLTDPYWLQEGSLRLDGLTDLMDLNLTFPDLSDSDTLEGHVLTISWKTEEYYCGDTEYEYHRVNIPLTDIFQEDIDKLLLAIEKDRFAKAEEARRQAEERFRQQEEERRQAEEKKDRAEFARLSIKYPNWTK